MACGFSAGEKSVSRSALLLLLLMIWVTRFELMFISGVQCYSNDLDGAIAVADNDVEMYNRQKKAGVDAIIMDDVAKLTKVCLPSPRNRLQLCSTQRRATVHLEMISPLGSVVAVASGHQQLEILAK